MARQTSLNAPHLRRPGSKSAAGDPFPVSPPRFTRPRAGGTLGTQARVGWP
eukprot:CAMPEP_0180283282 /NCGR_PEP_ID=MMETSP0988-20121125/10380_1 /TAXON_ID=697907 /ORGANISM="non described non described, Strain CCMP2293" /LENGTH=50 /DNA_ID=CAMNT_0022255779 /DNA_START=149 /DNA_END=297 /DNA_ORIENTATION=+